MLTFQGRWCVVWLGLCVAIGCGSKEPFDYVKVTGSVMYEDESLIQADQLEVTFYPQAPPKDPKTHPRPGVAIVDPATGTFTQVTSHKPNDGVVPGTHKVTVQTFDADRQPTDILPAEYTNVDTTPLEYDTATGPATIRVKKK